MKPFIELHTLSGSPFLVATAHIVTVTPNHPNAYIVTDDAGQYDENGWTCESYEVVESYEEIKKLLDL